MDEEEGSDKHLRGTFGAKWNRTKSEDLNKKFREQAKKYQDILTNARNADKIVRDKFEGNLRAIDIMSKDETSEKYDQHDPISSSLSLHMRYTLRCLLDINISTLYHPLSRVLLFFPLCVCRKTGMMRVQGMFQVPRVIAQPLIRLTNNYSH
eukprot:sb/3473408/